MAGNTLQEYVDEIDPILWESIQILTMSTAERTDPSSISAEACHIRFVRRFLFFAQWCFALTATIIYLSTHNWPPIIDGQGALIKILNRLGICASMDTLKRHVQNWHSRREDMVAQNLEADGFVIVSADNIDWVSRHARSTKQQFLEWNLYPSVSTNAFFGHRALQTKFPREPHSSGIPTGNQPTPITGESLIQCTSNCTVVRTMFLP